MSPRNFKTAFLRTIRRIIGYSIIVLCFIVATGLYLLEHHEPKDSFQTLTASVSAPGTPSAKAWALFDPKTGEILSGVHKEESYPIASVTKLFIAETVLRSPGKDTAFAITYADLETEGRAGKLVYGEQVTPYTLLFPLLIESSNDAGEAIRRFQGKEFDVRIQDIENQLVLRQTHIVDGSGLSVHNTSSAHDLAILYAYIKNTHPHILDITQLDTYIGPRTGYVNNNPAHSLPNFVGGKHGYTPEAGKTFVGSFMLPHSKREIGIVLLSSTDLLSDIEKLLASDILVP